jgi:translation initiation factor IF-2
LRVPATFSLCSPAIPDPTVPGRCPGRPPRVPVPRPRVPACGPAPADAMTPRRREGRRGPRPGERGASHGSPAAADAADDHGHPGLGTQAAPQPGAADGGGRRAEPDRARGERRGAPQLSGVARAPGFPGVLGVLGVPGVPGQPRQGRGAGPGR